MTSADVRLRAFELGELFWEHDRLTLRSLNPAQRQAQLKARERLVRHAKRVQDLLESGAIPAGDPAQQAAAKGMVELMQALWEHARDAEAFAASGPVTAARVPIPAPAGIWSGRTAQTQACAPPAPRPAPNMEQEALEPPNAMVCRRCAGKLERTTLAVAMGRPISQGWRHVDGRKTHLPDPVAARGGQRVQVG